MDLQKQIEILRKSNHFQSKWYRSEYRDVDIVGLPPVEHYVKYGAMLERNPGRTFDTKFYVSNYPDVNDSGLNPLVHYILHGESEGRLKKAADLKKPKGAARARVTTLRRKLLALGFVDRPIQELIADLDDRENPFLRAYAARELAMHHLRANTPEDFRICLDYLAIARECPEDSKYFSMLTVVEMTCYYHLNLWDEGHTAFERAKRENHVTTDVLFARSTFSKDLAEKIDWINQGLAIHDIPPVALLDDDSVEVYDRLTCHAPLEYRSEREGPCVTVLIAAFNAEATLPTALRSLQEQTWRNLEILVLDDCSLDSTVAVAERFAAQDRRIKVIRMPVNGGAYVARNFGLDQALGEFVTIHDADDWSHPLKIETQVKFLRENPNLVGCTSQQARTRSDLLFSRVLTYGTLTFTNTSSFMFRKKEMRNGVGYWDTVRFSADNELIRRLQLVYGEESVVHMNTGTLSFQRDSDSSIVAHEHFGVNGAICGIRQEYLEAQARHHSDATKLKYNNNPDLRPFPAPLNMRRSFKDSDGGWRHFDVIIASDFRMIGGSTASNAQEIIAQRARGLQTGIFQMSRYDLGAKTSNLLLPEIRELVDEDKVHMLTYGDKATCDLLIIRYPPVLQYLQKFLPEIKAKNIKVIINQPPMSDYSESGVMRYTFEEAAKNIRNYFGADATWHPIGPLVRQAILDHHAGELNMIELAEDWSNIIDIDGWSRGERRRGPADRLRIGRHSRDNVLKWPDKADDILAAYPAGDDVEVHVLGGATSPASLIGGVPDNWTVHEFGSLHPRDFLADIDIFSYFAHPDWVEAFGRTIIEAMAVGVPVILPEVYRPLFSDAALYSTPQESLAIARALHADPEAYDAQVDYAKTYAQKHFSYEMHMDRLRGSGVRALPDQDASR